jgi:hypothetical protein
MTPFEIDIDKANKRITMLEAEVAKLRAVAEAAGATGEVYSDYFNKLQDALTALAEFDRCPWCSGSKEIKPGEPMVSHGICPKHAKELMRKNKGDL